MVWCINLSVLKASYHQYGHDLFEIFIANISQNFFKSISLAKFNSISMGTRQTSVICLIYLNGFYPLERSKTKNKRKRMFLLNSCSYNVYGLHGSAGEASKKQVKSTPIRGSEVLLFTTSQLAPEYRNNRHIRLNCKTENITIGNRCGINAK